MAKCLVCSEFGEGKGWVIPEDRSGICPQCKADLELGRLVRAMPKHFSLVHFQPKIWEFWHNGSANMVGGGRTPEEALKALKGE